MDLSCLIKDTQLLIDVKKYVGNAIANAIQNKDYAGFNALYNELREDGFEIDQQSFGVIYKEVAQEMRGKFGTKLPIDKNSVVNQQTGETIARKIKRLINLRPKDRTAGKDSATVQVVSDLLSLLEPLDTNVQDSPMRILEQGLKKVAKTFIDKKGIATKDLTTKEILEKALNLDSTNIINLRGNLVGIQDLFNDLKQEINGTKLLIEKKKNGKNNADVDAKIAELDAITNNLINGTFELVLSTNEKQKIIREYLKKDYGKDINRGGTKVRILDYNKLFSSKEAFEDIINRELTAQGFDQNSIDKIQISLKNEYDRLRASAQWQNITTGGASQAVNDNGFLNRLTNEVVISKNFFTEKREKQQYIDQNGNEKTRTATVKVADVVAYEKATGQKINDLKQEIISDIKTENNASPYRQLANKLAMLNNGLTNIKKSDLAQLRELQSIHGFNNKFNAKALDILGMNTEDIQTLNEMNDLIEKSKIVNEELKDEKDADGKIIKNGVFSTEANSIIQQQINDLLTRHKNKTLPQKVKLMTAFSNSLDRTNAARVVGVLNAMQSTMSNVVQFISILAQSKNSETRKALRYGLYQGLSVATQDPNVSNVTGLSTTNRGAITKFLGYIPSAVLGFVDGIATSTLMYANTIKALHITETSRLIQEHKSKYLGNSPTMEQLKKIKEKAISNVSDAVFNEAGVKKARQESIRILKIVTPNPTERQINRETRSILIGNMANIDTEYTHSKLTAISNAANSSALIATGKKARQGDNKVLGDVLGFADKISKSSKANIKKALKEKRYGAATSHIFLDAIVNKFLLSFAQAGVNWFAIKANNTAGFLYSAVQINREESKKNIQDIVNLTDAQLEQNMGKYLTHRNNIASGISTFAVSAIYGGILALRSGECDDKNDKNCNDIKGAISEIYNDKENGKALTRTMPEQLALYAILTGAAQENKNNKKYAPSKLEMLGKYFGADALDRSFAGNIAKSLKYNNNDAATVVGMQSSNLIPIFNNVQTIGQYIGSGLSYYEFFKDEESDDAKDRKVKNFDNELFKAINEKSVNLKNGVRGDIESKEVKDANFWYKAASGYFSSLATYNTLKYLDKSLDK